MLLVLIHSIMSNSAINVSWILDLARRGLNAEFTSHSLIWSIPTERHVRSSQVPWRQLYKIWNCITYTIYNYTYTIYIYNIFHNNNINDNDLVTQPVPLNSGICVWRRISDDHVFMLEWNSSLRSKFVPSRIRRWRRRLIFWCIHLRNLIPRNR